MSLLVDVVQVATPYRLFLKLRWSDAEAVNRIAPAGDDQKLEADYWTNEHGYFLDCDELRKLMRLRQPAIEYRVLSSERLEKLEDAEWRTFNRVYARSS